MPNPQSDGLDTRTRIEPSRNSMMIRRSEEHTSELQSLMLISYAFFCLKKTKKKEKIKNKSKTKTKKQIYYKLHKKETRITYRQSYNNIKSTNNQQQHISKQDDHSR